MGVSVFYLGCGRVHESENGQTRQAKFTPAALTRCNEDLKDLFGKVKKQVESWNSHKDVHKYSTLRKGRVFVADAFECVTDSSIGDVYGHLNRSGICDLVECLNFVSKKDK